MVRRIASQVHKQAARLMRANYIKNEPVWFQAVLEHPPLPLPPRAPPVREDLSGYHPTEPLPIFYLEDKVRRQFFRDHPFEAFRPVSIVEGREVEDEHPIRGTDWTRLAQRGLNPSPEDAVHFAVNLHNHHKMALSIAYTRAVAEFRSLRAGHDFANTFARMEAEAYGTVFPSEIDRTFEKEDAVYQSADRKVELDRGALLARKRWKAILDVDSGMGDFDRGQQYTRNWKQGIRPTYLPVDELAAASEAGTPVQPMEQDRFVKLLT
ncbi:mitochondrial ribosomal protein S25-domain-containing protein [Suillus lakei]|nr:mitochondrial ribosomal protein S25-domain-containing protein [Suillus lakei]